MRRLMLTLAVLAALGLATGTTMAGHPDKNPRAEIMLASHHGGHHGGHYNYHHGHHRPWGYGVGVVVAPPVVYRPAPVVVPVPAYPPAYYYQPYTPRPHGSVGIQGRKFGFSIDF